MFKNIAVIGGGNLGQSIVNGLLAKDYNPSNITVTRNKTEHLDSLKAKGVIILNNNIEAVKNTDIIIIAVKPYKIKEVLLQIDPYISNNAIIVSVVSDFSIENISKSLKSKITIIRAMPNTAASVNESMTCLASLNASEKELEEVADIFNSLGSTLVINEQLMDAATVLGACGIAYVLRFIRGMIQGGIEIGFDAQTATKIATQTVRGATELLIKNGNHPEAEIDKVTTPKGCTIAGLNEMEHSGFSSALIKGIKTSFDNISK
ncbi:pyrroline-5-carboxylate reductase [Xanthomarina sp.]|uniref:pyrroline-5-carboxylate reductase n=1 Tax=Xanthomarina sp. TaxID=1931211 RepID=UPI002B50E377|nr:pyrroline-5-carboxylate reductase [Xanthomarina sp.]HLV38467.1 pyrroline-5-carboxylate reductase [Xanthomarina sp.]